MKRVSPCPSSSKKKKNNIDHRNQSITSQIKEMGLIIPICKSRNEASAAAAADSFHQSSAEDDIDIDKQFGKECVWLSSDCTTPSSFYEEYRLLSGSFFYPSGDEWLALWLSLLASYYDYSGKEITLFDEFGMIKPMEKTWQNDFKEEEVVVTRLLSSTSSENSADQIQSCEDSNTLLRTKSDSSSETLDLDKISYYSFSLVNLDSEDSEWISGNNLELDYFQSDFPSPSFKNSWCTSQVLSSSSSISSIADIRDEKPLNSSSEHEDEATLENFNTDEPLFWPFERKLEWSSEEAWSCFSISPRKDLITPATSVGLKLRSRNVNPKEWCRRRLVFISESPSSPKIMDRKQGDSNKGVRRIKTVPSRLSKSTKKSAKVVHLEEKDDTVEPKERRKVVPIKKSVGKDIKLQIDKEDFAFNGELPIETLLGLAEFDGHEGVELGFNGDVFSLLF